MLVRGIVIFLTILISVFLVFAIFWHSRAVFINDPENPIITEMAITFPVYQSNVTDYSSLVMTQVDSSGNYQYTYIDLSFTVEGDVWYRFHTRLRLVGTLTVPNPTEQEWLNIWFPAVNNDSVSINENNVQIMYDYSYFFIDYNDYITDVSPIYLYSFDYFPLIEGFITFAPNSSDKQIVITAFYFDSSVNSFYVLSNGSFVVDYIAQIGDVMINTRPTTDWSNVLSGIKGVFYDYPKWLISFFELLTESYGGLF